MVGSLPQAFRAVRVVERAKAAIARAEAQAAEPRDPEMVRRAEEAWRLGQERRLEREQEASRRAERERAAAPAAKPPVTAEARTGLTESGIRALTEGMAPVIREAMNERQDAIEQALGQALGERDRKSLWRTIEAERRIAELEARLAKLEGQRHG